MFYLKHKKLIPFVFLACLVFFLAISVIFARPLLFTILKYPLNFFTSVGREIKGIILYHSNYTENERLKKENGLLRLKINEAIELSQENKRLKELLSFKQKSPYKVIPAAVIGHSSDNWSSALIINRGRLNGIKKGYVVVHYQGLVGRVTETSANSSKIMLINDPALSISCIDQRSRQEGLVSAALGSSLVMKYLPKDADVQVSDAIVTSGLTELFPKGLVVGTVSEVGDEFSGLSRFAIIKPAVNLSSVEEVLVIIP